MGILTAIPRVTRAALCAVLVVAGTAPAMAVDIDGDEALKLELNAFQSSESGCRITFVVANDLDGDIGRAAYELAFFDADGLVTRLTVVDFLELDRGRTKVRQYEFADMACDSISRILVNDVAECSGEGIAATSCIDRLTIENQTSIQFGT